MTVDREQTRWDDFQTVQEAVASIQASLAPGALKRSRDALDALQRIRAELEQAERDLETERAKRLIAVAEWKQAERERDEAQRELRNMGLQRQEDNAGVFARLNAAEARLVKADTLAEALKQIAETSRWYANNDARLQHEVDHALCVEIVSLSEDALADYEQDQRSERMKSSVLTSKGFKPGWNHPEQKP